MKKANMISGIVLLLSSLALLIFIIPSQIEEVTDATVSPRFMPYVCTSIILILAVILTVKNLPSRKEKPNPDDEISPISKAESKAMLAVSGVLVLSVVLFELFGGLISAAILIVLMMWLMGERRFLPFVLLPGGLLLTTYLIFYKILGTSIQ